MAIHFAPDFFELFVKTRKCTSLCYWYFKLLVTYSVSNTSSLRGIAFEKVGLEVHTPRHPSDPGNPSGVPITLGTSSSAGSSIDGTFLRPLLETEAVVYFLDSNRRSDVLGFVKQSNYLRWACQYCCLIWKNKNTHAIRAHLLKYHSNLYTPRLRKMMQTLLICGQIKEN